MKHGNEVTYDKLVKMALSNSDASRNKCSVLINSYQFSQLFVLSFEQED